MPALLVFVLVVAAAAVFGAQFMPGAWYAALLKPAWTPPNWLFGPVWTLLYIAIAFAGWRVWRAAHARRPLALGLWWAQWLCNGLWSWLFFGLHRPDLALIDIGLLLACIVAFVVVAWRIDRIAAWLFVPYAVWVSYASSLNLWIWLNNPGS